MPVCIPYIILICIEHHYAFKSKAIFSINLYCLALTHTLVTNLTHFGHHNFRYRALQLHTLVTNLTHFGYHNFRYRALQLHTLVTNLTHFGHHNFRYRALQLIPGIKSLLL